MLSPVSLLFWSGLAICSPLGREWSRLCCQVDRPVCQFGPTTLPHTILLFQLPPTTLTSLPPLHQQPPNAHPMPAHTPAPAKKKRVIKSRQSLAEKKTGTTMFPIARVKRIIKADKDLDMMSSEATFLISVATVSSPVVLSPLHPVASARSLRSYS